MAGSLITQKSKVQILPAILVLLTSAQCAQGSEIPLKSSPHDQFGKAQRYPNRRAKYSKLWVLYFIARRELRALNND